MVLAGVQTPGYYERKLRLLNLSMGVVHLAQAFVLIVLASDFTLPVTGAFMDGPPGVGQATISELWSVNIAWAVISFVLMTGGAHLLIASPVMFRLYASELAKGRNYARWAEYSITSSIMMVLIAMLTGISDGAAIVSIFGANSAMILFGALMEHYESPGKANWAGYVMGSIIGLVPWMAIGLYLWSPTSPGEPPAFVYGIFFSLFIFFNSFALNMLLQYKKIGPWRNYVFGETIYMWLSLLSKSALVWQIFSATLIPTP